ncbi:ankyrin repeat protein [Inquilinus ginsengisoli]|uniref:Ankyrin repeat protein n=1 Tax=Inquilinus ginsengisoli TaxID=363840 RepID=A0ABU1JQJ7_9PROT|nr:ankyrin repeat domain-containing protein [Inquilinus ginsengisoli]MDR6290883.1 ankyrin repeat protein [Inquilinus ginsengisoli]
MGIQEAVLRGDVNAVKASLDAGDLIDQTDRLGRTPLMNAAIDKKIEVARLLLERNADPNLSDERGWTALHFSSQAQASELIVLLLQFGADVDPTDDNGNTPLFRAVFSYKGDGRAIEALLLKSADREKTNKHGVSPKSLAFSISNYDARKYFV